MPRFACHTEHEPGAGHHLYAHGTHPLGSTFGGPTWWDDQRLRILEHLTIRCCCGHWENTSTRGLHAELDQIAGRWIDHASADLAVVRETFPDSGVHRIYELSMEHGLGYAQHVTRRCKSCHRYWLAPAVVTPRGTLWPAPGCDLCHGCVVSPTPPADEVPLFDDLLQLIDHLETINADGVAVG